MVQFAHTLKNKPPEEWQPLADHLQNVAEIAECYARAFNADGWGRIAGLLHDIGKYRPEFQEKLIKQSERRVDHKSVGAKIAHDLLGDAGKLLSYCIAGHHGGLPNYGYPGSDGSASLAELLNQAPSLPENAPAITEQLTSLALPFNIAADNPTLAFYQLSFFTRLIYSALVDADFLDTEQFIDPGKAAERHPGPLVYELLDALNEKLKTLQSDTSINALRSQILMQCRKNAALSPGFFALTVPTGGGKTLSSMAFALEHALKNDFRRIFYVVPYTSIIEQNASVFRNIFPPGTVVEHHSNFDERTLPVAEDTDQFGAGLRHRLACENWDAPVVVTTNVQFFESLYAAKPSQCRKLHNLSRSVIILDEAQMLPVDYLDPCLRALEGIVHIGQSSVVLCTATQPALKKNDQFIQGVENIREIAPDPGTMHQKFLRTYLEDLGTLSLSEVAGHIRTKPQVLCIVNTRARAAALFGQLENAHGIRHLSALMCPAHRSRTISEMRSTLEKGDPCRVVSTQLVEAGVDISFPEVIREMAGLDSITQAAGRCNREGKMHHLGKVSIFTPEEGLARAFSQAAGNTRATLRQYESDPFSPEAVEYFFSETYWLKKEFLDRKKILDEFKNTRPQWAFRDAADRFRLIENDMLPIIIPYDAGARNLITELRHALYPTGTLRQLQQYTVQVYRHQFDALDRVGSIELIDGGYAVLSNGTYYHERTGLVMPDHLEDAGDFIF